MATAATSPSVPALSWDDFRDLFTWRQGEHLTMVGPTGSGKTTLAAELLGPAMRPAPWTAVISTKRRDPVIDRFRRRGYRTMGRWAVPDAEVCPRVVLAPKLAGFDSIDRQRERFREALDSVFRQGGWTLYLDECRYLTDYLRLSREVEVLWQQGRSHGITVVAGIQRPRHVPLLAYDQASHLFFWRDNDRRNLDRLSELGGVVDADELRALVAGLGRHEVAYLNAEPPGTLVRTTPPAA